MTFMCVRQPQALRIKKYWKEKQKKANKNTQNENELAK